MACVLDRKSTRLNSSHTVIYTSSLHDALPIYLMIKTNKYIDDMDPWTLGADRKEELGDILLECFSVLRVVAVFYHPFMPEKTQAIWERLGEKEPIWPVF